MGNVNVSMMGGGEEGEDVRGELIWEVGNDCGEG